MKILLAIRHAKSSWDTPLPDFERPLNARGERDAPSMAKRLKEKRIHPDIVLTSPAMRAAATCNAFVSTLKFPANRVIADPALYHASEETLFDIVSMIKDRNDDDEVVLLFGHNPGLTEFVNTLADANIDNIPTTGVVAIKVNAKSWAEIKPGCGQVLWFDYPKKGISR